MSTHLLLPLTILCAKFFEEIARRIGIPAILGAIFAGIILGPAGLQVTPDLFHSNQGDNKLFSELAQIGLCVLLFRIGTENRFDQFRKVWPQATGVAVSGMLLPLVLGWGAAMLLGLSLLSSLFIGATLTATSIGITIPVLKALGGMATSEGLIIASAAVLDDILGLLLLSLLMLSIHPEQYTTQDAWLTMLLGVGFVIAAILIGPWLIRRILGFLRFIKSTQLLLVFAFSYLLVMAQLAHNVGLDMIIGAYGAGIAFSTIEERDHIESGLKPFTDLFSPLFFVLIGSSVTFPDLSPLSPEGIQNLKFLSLLLIAAFAGKLFSGIWVSGPAGKKWIVGCGMLPRGEVGLVFAQIGLSTNTITNTHFSLLVLLLIITTYCGPLLLKRFWVHKAP